MMQKKRPVLRPGDICRVSKKHRHNYNASTTYTVIKVAGDGSSRNSMITVAASVPSRFGRDGFKKPEKLVMSRRYLWYTGYNINEGKTNKSRVVKEVTKGSELCKNETCGKQKDIGRPCWWCGT